MRYASIRDLDISNGEGVGMSLFVQGCHFHCKDCFNQETWDFNGGKEWTDDIQRYFMELLARPYIQRISILGGEPLAPENAENVLKIVNEIRLLFGNEKQIWLYSGYSFEECTALGKGIDQTSQIFNQLNQVCYDIIEQCDVMVDGRYEADKKNLAYKWAGSTNQRVIDVKKTISERKIILWE